MHLREQRRHLRAPVSLPVACRDTGRGTVFLAATDDLSASGAAFRAAYRAPRAALLFLAVGHEDAGLAFCTPARVVRTLRTKDGDYLWAVRFVDLTLEDAARIGRYVVRRHAQLRRTAHEVPHPADAEWTLLRQRG